MIEFRQCSLRLFRFCDWSSLFSDNSPYCKFLNHSKFHSQWSRHQLHEICSKWSKTSKRQRFWCLKGRVLLPDSIWPQLKPIQNWQKSRNKKPTWWEHQCCGGISFELRVFAQESNFLGPEFVCLFFVSQKCRHWILVEDYGMHVNIRIYDIYIYLYLFMCTFVWKHIKKHTLCIFICLQTFEDVQHVSPVWAILFESCCLQFGIDTARPMNGSNGCNMPRCIQSCLR